MGSFSLKYTRNSIPIYIKESLLQTEMERKLMKGLCDILDEDDFPQQKGLVNAEDVNLLQLVCSQILELSFLMMMLYTMYIPYIR